MADLFEVFLLSITPFGELRLSIPVGILVYHLDVASVFCVSVLGNSLLAGFLIFFLKKIVLFFSSKSSVFKKSYDWWENNARKKHSDKIQKFGVIGLLLFVAVPLPFTGVWTGSLLATIMDLPLKKSWFAVSAGAIVSGLIVAATVLLGVSIEKYLGWEILLVGVAILVLAISIARRFMK